MAKPEMTSAEFRKSGLQLRTRSATTDYKALLLEQVAQADLPIPKAELQFNENRGWRFDFYYDDQQIAIEYEGGIFDKGASGHKSVSGIMRDIEKYNEAALAGWTVIRVTAQSVTSGAALRYIRRALEKGVRAEQKSDTMAHGEIDKLERELLTIARRIKALKAA